jgi:uncharacterized protein (UPF0276 family)
LLGLVSVEGVGVLFRDAFAEALLGAARPPVDWLEIVPEDFLERGARARRTLDALSTRYTLVPHAVSLSLGGVDPLDEVLLERLTGLVRELDPPWWSEHLGCVRVEGSYTQAVLPLPMSEEAALHLGARARLAAARVGKPLLLENFAAYAVMPGSALDEAAFLRAVCEASGCDLLLDVSNLWLNARNFGHDAEDVVDRLPIERVREIHLAGYELKDGFAVDSHSRPVPEEAWRLYRRVIARAGRLVPTLIEWEVDLPPAERLFQEVARARTEAARALGGSP